MGLQGHPRRTQLRRRVAEQLDRIAARQVDDPALRFGGENDTAEFDWTVNTQVLGNDPIGATDMGLRNIDRVVPMLIPATTSLGRPYYQLSEVCSGARHQAPQGAFLCREDRW